MGRAFEKRKHTIFARMDRVAKQFSKIGKDIAIAVKAGGSSPDGNPALRRALQSTPARSTCRRTRSTPRSRRRAARARPTTTSWSTRATRPHGIAVMVETATDNVTRTVANVRSYFKMHGGNMGTTGQVAFMFQRQGVFRLDPEGVDRDSLELELIDHGLRLARGRRGRQGREAAARARARSPTSARCRPRSRRRKIHPLSTASEYVPATTTELPEDKADEVLKLVAALEDDDDVQNVYTNLA